MRPPLRRVIELLSLATLGCSAGGSRYITVASETRADTVVLRLLPVAGVRINARLKPALERPDGTVLRFEGTALTPDSSYFTTPPALAIRGSAIGTIRASVCPAEDSVCRMVTVGSER